jgi:hypothetical protein
MLHKKHVLRKKSIKRPAMTTSPFSGWLLFFYTVPAKPVNNRMKIWRRLNRSGAIQFKGSAYLLPACEDHREFFNWLVEEVHALSGEAAVVRTEHIESMQDAELIALFKTHREEAYEPCSQALADLNMTIESIHNAGGTAAATFKRQFQKAWGDFQRVNELDFFGSPRGKTLRKGFKKLRNRLESFDTNKQNRDLVIPRRDKAAHQGKTWSTRPCPFVDRMATAWLIATYIDPKAQFHFVQEEETSTLPADAITFDLPGATLTHVGDLCTYEVTAISFGLEGKSIEHIGRIVHDLDLKDNKHGCSEGKGLEDILRGIQKTAASDLEQLAKGMEIFALLHASLET